MGAIQDFWKAAGAILLLLLSVTALIFIGAWMAGGVSMSAGMRLPANVRSLGDFRADEHRGVTHVRAVDDGPVTCYIVIQYGGSVGVSCVKRD